MAEVVQAKPHPKFKANCATAVEGPAVWGRAGVAMALDQRQGTGVATVRFVAEDGFGSSPIWSATWSSDQRPGPGRTVRWCWIRRPAKRAEGRSAVEKAAFSTLPLPTAGRAAGDCHRLLRHHQRSGQRDHELAARRVDLRDRLAAGDVGNAVRQQWWRHGRQVRGGASRRQRRPSAVAYRIKDAVPYVITPVVRWPLVFVDRSRRGYLHRRPTGRVPTPTTRQYLETAGSGDRACTACRAARCSCWRPPTSTTLARILWARSATTRPPGQRVISAHPVASDGVGGK